VRNIEARSYPNNVSELEAAVNRAVVQATQQQTAAGLEGGAAAGAAAGGARAAAPAPPTVIGEEVFWFASQAKDLRLDLLRSMPLLRGFLRSEVWPQKINFGFTAYAFAAVVALLFLGPQDRAHNVALNVFWCDWWALSFVAFPFLGRVWCSVCPFMIYGVLVQRWRRATGATLLKWPREAMEEWGPWFLFWLFAGILVWEEVWDLPGNAALSSWLLLLITGGAMVGSFFFERRIWCRYLCPIGGMNGAPRAQGVFAPAVWSQVQQNGVCSRRLTCPCRPVCQAVDDRAARPPGQRRRRQGGDELCRGCAALRCASTSTPARPPACCRACAPRSAIPTAATRAAPPPRPRAWSPWGAPSTRTPPS
jgi:hypothetical protein